MKKRVKIFLDNEILEIIIPGASLLEGLPRKKKKRLKKFISKKIMEIALNEALRNDAFDKLKIYKKINLC